MRTHRVGVDVQEGCGSPQREKADWTLLRLVTGPRVALRGLQLRTVVQGDLPPRSAECDGAHDAAPERHATWIGTCTNVMAAESGSPVPVRRDRARCLASERDHLCRSRYTAARRSLEAVARDQSRCPDFYEHNRPTTMTGACPVTVSSLASRRRSFG